MNMHHAAKVPIGRIMATPGVLAVVSEAELSEALSRHADGDWGEVGDEDRKANDDALRDGTRILSAYRTQDGTKFWIITEADRSSTTALLPEEY
jgi:hypothetical protein